MKQKRFCLSALTGLLILFALPLAGQQTDTLRYPINDDQNPFIDDRNNMDFDDPQNLTREIKYDPDSDTYLLITKIGDEVMDVQSMTFEEYQKFALEYDVKDYWRKRSDFDMDMARGGREPDLSRYLDTTKIPFFDVQPSGSVDLTAGSRFQRVDNPTIPLRQRKTGGMDFDMGVQMGITGSIAERLQFDATYNTESNFNVGRNLFKVGYQGKEDDILQVVDFGNVSLPLRSSLIQGNQSLLGVKTEMQFGRLNLTSVISQQESRTQGLQLEGGTQKRNFSIKADEYEENKHFFLGHYFRDQYEQILTTLPTLSTPFNITRLEVWVTNINFQTTNIREFVAFTDLGEFSRINQPGIVVPTPGATNADNGSNSLYKTLTASGAQIRRSETAPAFLGSLGLNEIEDFEIITARQLERNEFDFNQQLGFISLNRSLAPDEVLAVAYEYTDLNGNLHQVGEFSENLGLDQNQQDQLLILKLLKPKAPLSNVPSWDLMMKNVYPLGAFRINREDFRLDLYYADPGDGVKRYLPVEDDTQPLYKQALIRATGLDRFDSGNFPRPDGVFDFLEGSTINTRTGRLYFPVLEPFGDYLTGQLSTGDAEKFVFDELYDLTKSEAQQFPEFNRYSIVGTYKSELTDEISLGAFNIPQGSLTVTGGGRHLIEGVDYTIDYNLGRLKVLNTALVQSGVPLNVRYENNLSFGFDSKRLMGTRADYYINDNFNLGGTFMNLQEKPFSNKVNLGDDPISNSVLGFDLNYEKESPWLTRLVDNIPGINTKQPSSVNFVAEAARFIPGHSKQIGRKEAGQVYIDDFEGSSASYDLKFPALGWIMASTPRRFPESQALNMLEYGYNRAKLSWYNIDPVLSIDNNNQNEPPNIGPNERSDLYGRAIFERELFPNSVNERRTNLPLTTFDLTYYPNERGPYNFDAQNVNLDGSLQNPESRWGGIMREISVTDFQEANVEFVEFWLMDPFLNDPTNNGKLYINLGNISEDILRDGRKFFENGLPEPNQVPNLDQTVWGNVPNTLNINNAFSSDNAALLAQDVGLDGLNNDEELSFFQQYLNNLQTNVSSGAFQLAQEDPASDDYHHFLGDDYDQNAVDIVNRYKHYNSPHGNSSASGSGSVSYNAKNAPDTEDINRDNTLERSESYFEYEIELDRAKFQIGQNYIVSEIDTLVDLPNGTSEQVKWYQFKIPISSYTQAVNGIQSFQSIRFIRMYLTEFERDVTLRFGSFDLLRNQWRRYQYELDDRNVPVNPIVDFNVFPVNIEENQNKVPFGYVLPPGIQREEIQGSTNTLLRNEQSLAINACSLPDGDGRAIYKILNLDLRNYEEMKMFVHAESLIAEAGIKDDDVELFIRLGADFSENYYEYSIPLKVTPPGMNDPFSVWPEENNVNIDLKGLVDLKLERNRTSGASPFDPYYNSDSTHLVLGTPDLGLASLIMIGVRNPAQKSRPDPNDDGLAKCAEVWINELRVTGFNEQPGYAALARADFQMADFANVSVSGNLHTSGYGSLEQRIDQRYRDDYTQLDVSGTFNLDKFVGKKSGLKIPLFASYSRTSSKPQYDPYELDVELKHAPDSVKNAARDLVQIKSINLTNVRKERTDPNKKQKIYDIENFNLSYSYTEKTSQTPNIFDEMDKTHFGALAYNFSPREKTIEPFRKIFAKGKYLAFLRDFNLNLFPSNISVRTDMKRRFQETYLRDIQNPSKALEPYYYKDWTWNRHYDLGWDLTKSLSLDFRASNQSRIDEPEGRNDNDFKKDSVWNNIKDLGRNILYDHSATVNYRVPLDKFPILSFINIDAGYKTNYTWRAGALELTQLGVQQENRFGNVINNSRGLSLSADLNFNDLYNQSKFFKLYNEKRRTRSGGKQRDNTNKQRPNTNPKKDPNDPNAKKEKREPVYSSGTAWLVKPLLSIKRATFNYTSQRGTTVPGFTPTPKNFGQDLNINAPGWGFVFGSQPDPTAFLDNAAANNWITTEPDFSYRFLQDKTTVLNATASLQPFDDLNIEVNLDYSKATNYNELFRNDGTVSAPNFKHINPFTSGSYDISFISFNTIFDGIGDDDIPLTFRDFETKRIEASQILGDLNPSSTTSFVDNPAYRQGYGPYSQEVLMAAFLSAYTGKEISSIALDPFDTKPLPNWRLSYNGLTRIPFFNKHFTSFKLNHAYRSNFSINQFNTNLNYERGNFQGYDDYFLPSTFDTLSNNFYSLYYIPQIRITETFAPLAGLDLAMKNGLTLNFDYRKSRTLGMSLIDYQLSEQSSTDFVIGAGFRTKNFKLPIRFGGKQTILKNDLIFRLDYSLRDDIVVNYKLDQNTALPTRGSKTTSLIPTIDYVLNDRMNMQLYFDKRKSEPKTRNSYPISNTRSGIKLSYVFTR